MTTLANKNGPSAPDWMMLAVVLFFAFASGVFFQECAQRALRGNIEASRAIDG